MKIRVAGIAQDSIVDGPGIRMTVFVQGCPHRCEGCHNPETWGVHSGKLMDTEEIIAMMEANPLLDGITLSGGEPLWQPFACMELARAAHERGLSVWCYTGYEFGTVLVAYTGAPGRGLLDYVDVLVDGPYMQDQRTLELPWRGSKNQRLIDVQESLRTGKIVEYKGDTK